MRNIQKKPLTHKQCVKGNHTILSLFTCILFMLSILVPLLIEDCSGIIVFLFCTMFFIIGLYGLITTLKNRAKLAAGMYFVYLDMVAGKRKQEGEDSTIYYLQFANNEYEHSVSRTVYYETATGTPYYLIQFTNAKKAYAAYPESQYYIHQSLQRKFRAF